jgi:hypothetical protein
MQDYGRNSQANIKVYIKATFVPHSTESGQDHRLILKLTIFARPKNDCLLLGNTF